MSKDIPNKESIGIPLCISGSAFVLLWLASMGICPIIDAILVFSVILFTIHGIYRGGIRTLLGFAGAMIALLLAIYAYDKLYLGLELNLSEITPLWGQFICFLIILLGSWIVWYILTRFFLQWQKIALKNSIAGGILGFSEGIVIVYIFLMIILSSQLLESHPVLENEQEKSFLIQKSRQIFPNDHFAKLDLIVRFQKFHLHKKIQWIAENLASDDERLRTRILDFLSWLAQNPSSMEKWIFHSETQKSFEKILQIPEVKKYWFEEEYLQKLKQKKIISIQELCYLLQKGTSLKLAKNAGVKEILQAINFEKIKSGI